MQGLVINIDRYEVYARKELNNWKRRMRRRPSLINKASKGVQDKLNSMLPEKYHEALTFAIKNMVKLVLAGSQYMNQFDWRTFQQEYRDYIDLAKLAQMLPGVGAVVGFFTNGKLIHKLGETAMNSYRMRILK
ncbi:MAG: EcsC family protein [Tissierellia bacterium]|nr:EcsC family protein [Tissierellia bacterium]